MSSCGEDASLLHFGCYPRKHASLSPATIAQLQQECFAKKRELSVTGTLDAMKECVNLENADIYRENAAAHLRRQFSALQAIQNEQQRSMASQGDTAFNKRHTQAVSESQIPAESFDKNVEVREVLQRLLENRAKSIAYGAQISYADLAAVSKQSVDLQNCNPSYLTTRARQDFSAIKSDLLPPPPRLPTTTQAMLSSQCTALSVGNSLTSFSNTTSASYLPAHLKQDENSYTSTPVLTQNDSSSVEINQPLDLSTSNKRQQRNVNESLKENYVMLPAQPVSCGKQQAKPSLPTSENPVMSDRDLFLIRNLASAYANQGHTLPAFLNLSPQQMLLLAPYLQNAPASLMETSSAGKEIQSDPSPTTAQEYLQKLFWEACQRHQVAAMQHQQKSSRKRVASAESEQQHRYSSPPKTMLMNNRMRGSSQQNGQFRESSKSPSVIATNAKRYKRYAKPPYSYVSLITLAILSSPQKKLRLSQILKRISDMFPFFKGSYQGWRDSVRHNLSQNECFVKVLKNPCRPTAKGNYWSVNISLIPHELLLRQNTLVSRCTQESGFTYRKDLTEVFDVFNGNIKVEIPQHLIKGARLIHEPAAVMEVLLLEPRREGDVIGSDATRNTRGYSLVDMFPQDDCIGDNVLSLHHQSLTNSRWPGKPAKAGASVAPTKLVLSPQHLVYPSVSYSQYVSNTEPHKLAISQNSNGSFTLNAEAQLQAQKEYLAQALAKQMPDVKSLPFLRHYLANNSQQPIQLEKNTMPQEDSNPTNVPVARDVDVLPTSPLIMRDSNARKTSEFSNLNSSRTFVQDVTPEHGSDHQSKPASPEDPPTSECSLMEQESSPVDHPLADDEATESSSPLPVYRGRSRSSDVSSETVELSSPSIGDEVLPVPPTYPIPFTGFNIRLLELTKSV